jgi:MFS transporter, OFA family, oxalate/formate antiporter
MAALFVVTFGVANPFAAFGVFLPVLVEAFGWSRGAISVALSINLLLGGVAGFAVGAIADRHGPRAPLTVMALCAGAGFGLVSTVRALWQLYLFVGIMGGIGLSGFYVLSTATVARWFERRRGLALGVVLTGFNLGYMTGGPAAAWLIERFGWREAYALLGGGVAVVGSLASLAIRYPSRGGAAKVIQGGQTGEPTPRLLASPASASDRSLPGGVGLGPALGDSRLWSLSLAWFVTGFVMMMTSVHIVPYATDRGVRLEAAALALTAYGVGSIIGRLAFGPAADRFGSPLAMRSCFALQILALVFLLIGSSPAVLVLSLVAFGVGFAGADAVFVKTIPEVFGVRALGSIMGVLTFGWRCGGALGPAAAGYLHDATGSYAIPFALMPAAVVTGFALFVIGTSSRARRG